MGKTIKFKILIFSCTLLLAVVVCQIFFSTFLSKSYYTYLKKNQVETLFVNIKKNYSDDQNIIRDIVQYAENAYSINVQILNEDKIIYGNFGNSGYNLFRPGMNLNNRDQMYSFNPKAFILKPLEMPQLLNLPNLPQLRNDNIVLTGKFEYNDTIRYVRLVTSVESIDVSVAALTRVNTIIAVFILLIGVLCSLIFAKIFSRPIQNIQEVARNVSLLNFDLRADENLSITELCDLSGSINIMSDKLKNLISDLQISNEKLQADVDNQKRIDKMRREFIANVSHELKTPLHLLLMYSENLKSNINGIDKDYYCNTIIEETNRLNDMVNSLLDLSAIENGVTKLNIVELDFSELSITIVSKMAVLYKGLKVNTNIEKELLVGGDDKYLERVVKNYIVNAIAHTPSNGQISITLKSEDNKAVFMVFNEGNHILEEDLVQIWDSFYKTNKARVRTDENHVGLGLYVVKTIIEAHGGKYGVKNVENGVIFWFSLIKK